MRQKKPTSPANFYHVKEILFSLSLNENKKYSLQEIIDKFPPNTNISEIFVKNNDDYDYGSEFFYYKKIKNTNLDKEIETYNKRLKTYNKKLESYKIKLKE